MEIKTIEIFEAFDGTRFFDEDKCISYETHKRIQIKEEEEKVILEDRINKVVNIIIESKLHNIINFEELTLRTNADLYNTFVHYLNKLSYKIHSKGGMNGGGDLIITHPLNERLVSGAKAGGSRYKIILNEELDRDIIFVMNKKLLDTKLKTKDLRMFGIINIVNK